MCFFIDRLQQNVVSEMYDAETLIFLGFYKNLEMKNFLETLIFYFSLCIVILFLQLSRNVSLQKYYPENSNFPGFFLKKEKKTFNCQDLNNIFFRAKTLTAGKGGSMRVKPAPLWCRSQPWKHTKVIEKLS